MSTLPGASNCMMLWLKRKFFTACWILPFPFGPEARVDQIFEHAVANEVDLLRRDASLCSLRSRQIRLPGIAVNVYPFVEDLFTDAGLATWCGKRTAAFFSATGVKTKREESDW